MQMMISTYLAASLKRLCKTPVPLTPVRKKIARIKWRILDRAEIFMSVFDRSVINHKLVIRVDCYK
jgi:hypothetical protein